MNVIEHQHYGPPDVLTLAKAPKPVPKADEVLIKVYAAAANPKDWRKLRAKPFFLRFSEGLFQPKQPLLGADIAGCIEAVGSQVTQFKVGDDVFGDVGVGGFADYVCSPEANIVHKPANVSFEAAAAIPVAALTALQGLRDHGQLQARQHVLINGASGGIGSYAVQLAKLFGAEVTGVCSRPKLEFVHDLGADHVIDYNKSDITRMGQHYDLVFDLVGNMSAAGYTRVLNPEGKAVVAGFSTLSHMLVHVMLLGSLLSRKNRQTVAPMLSTVKQEDLLYMAQLLEQGTITSVIDRCYSLEDTAQAITYLEQGRARGKLIIQVARV
ncbi:MAG: NAD(P)-dependent alcohol dehydrogenase [Deinococcota bacterium]